MALAVNSFAFCNPKSRVDAPNQLLSRVIPTSWSVKKTHIGATKGVSSVCQPLPPDRPLWFPGSSPPEWLDGSLPGDFGFDPLGLGKLLQTTTYNAPALNVIKTAV
uniref:Uncharacterized protein n=1 Tax=Ananas comosus var. bracteatus TaxID=296719 RepID=A0A6V7P955_ANACO|nr:unnamed protein product [Ananas comosus var. bracteatus]